MTDDAGDIGLASGSDFTVQSLTQVQATGPELPSPTKITDAVGPVWVASERREAVRGVTHEAADSVRVQAEKERNEEVVGVPESLERLLPDAVMSRCVHQQHAEKHDVAGDATSLRVVNLHGRDRTNLGLLDVEEAVPVSILPVCSETS
jgi:hypothetical protein